MFSRGRKASAAVPVEGEPVKEYRICVLGSAECGKSALVTQFFQHKFLDTYTPTILHSFSRMFDFDGDSYILHIDDTSGKDEYSKERERSMDTCQSYLCVYAINSSESFQYITNVMDKISKSFFAKTKTKSEKKQRIPMILCGTKNDQEVYREVKLDQPIRLSRRFDCSFVEVTSKELSSVKKLFQTLIRDIQRIDSQNDPVKMSETKKKKNMLEYFLPRRPSHQELMEKKIMPSLTEFDFPSFGSQESTSPEEPQRKRSNTLSSLKRFASMKSIKKSVSKKEDKPPLDTLFTQPEEAESLTLPPKIPPFLKVRANTEDMLERRRNRSASASVTSSNRTRTTVELSQDPTIGPIMYPEAVDQPAPQLANVVEFNGQTSVNISKPFVPPRRVFSAASVTVDSNEEEKPKIQVTDPAMKTRSASVSTMVSHRKLSHSTPSSPNITSKKIAPTPPAKPAHLFKEGKDTAEAAGDEGFLERLLVQQESLHLPEELLSPRAKSLPMPPERSKSKPEVSLETEKEFNDIMDQLDFE